MRSFDDLVQEGRTVPVAGWDFSWFAGRASEARPPWGYARLLGQRMADAQTALDLQTGGGEVLATVPEPPPALYATESWPPNLAIAARTLAPLGGRVVAADDVGELPFRRGTFDLVTSRHPTGVRWDEVHRVLQPGGRYFAQHVGPGSVRELTDAMMGPQPVHPVRRADVTVASAEAAGLTLLDLREASLEMEFLDIGAVIVFLRKVIWIVPGFTVDAYLEPLARLDAQIRRDGRFIAHSQRFLIELGK